MALKQKRRERQQCGVIISRLEQRVRESKSRTGNGY